MIRKNTKESINRALKEIRNYGRDYFDTSELEEIVRKNDVSLPTFKKYVEVVPFGKWVKVPLGTIVEALESLVGSAVSNYPIDYDFIVEDELPYLEFKEDGSSIYGLKTFFRVGDWKETENNESLDWKNL